MSTQRGNNSKKRPPKHKNSHGFKNDKYDTSDKMKAINNLRVSNVCHRCKDCIEWKVKYKKYKPLTTPAHCVRCSQKRVKYAYHMICTDCALEHKVCGKCNQKTEIVDLPEKPPVEQQREENYLREELKHMKEREKRTFLRKLERGDLNVVSKVINQENSDDSSEEGDCSDNENINNDGTTECKDKSEFGVG